MKQIQPAPARDVLLALPSRDCLCASIKTLDLPARQRREAMLYRFEEKLPVSAEEIAADFVAGDANALGVAVEKRLLDPLIAAIEAAGMRVAGAFPASLLALQHWVEMEGAVSSPAEMVLWSDGASNAELFLLREGRPAAWFMLPEVVDDVSRHVQVMLLSEPRATRLVGCGISSDISSRLTELGVNVAETNSLALRDAAIKSGVMVLADKRQAWVNLGGSGASGGRGTMRDTQGDNMGGFRRDGAAGVRGGGAADSSGAVFDPRGVLRRGAASGV